MSLPGHPKARRSWNSGFRRELVALHREIFRRNQKHINKLVVGYSAKFRSYEAEYLRAAKAFDSVASIEDLDRAIANAEVAYVGDYHTLAQAQRSFVRLIRRVPRDRPVTIALEYFEGRHQPALDAFMKGGISEKTFLKRIDNNATWGWRSV
jgi:uncharacterized iron-regulated protein